MVLYQLRNPETIEALPLPDGNYAIIRDGKLTTVAKADFEAKFVPFVRG